jgi:putative phosphoribosyl transferase
MNNVIHSYVDRQDAGEQLASLLQSIEIPTDSIVLALPRGGVPVAYEISKKLKLPLDVLIVRKLGAPNYSEYAIGSIAINKVILLNKTAINQLNISDFELKKIIEKEHQELQRREHLYRGNRVWPNLKNKTVILVDDGIATGFSIKAAITSLKLDAPKAIILVTPVSSKEAIIELQKMVNQIICPLIPKDFNAVGVWYQYFPQITDIEVCQILHLNEINL